MKNSKRLYQVKLETYDDQIIYKYYPSRKRAYAYIYLEMMVENNYRYCRVVHRPTGEIWLEINWRGKDNYKRK